MNTHRYASIFLCISLVSVVAHVAVPGRAAAQHLETAEASETTADRIFSEAGHAALVQSLLFGVTAGIVLGAGAQSADGLDDALGILAVQGMAVTGYTLGSVFLTPYAVNRAGNAYGRDGSYWASVLGSVVATLPSFAIASQFDGDNPGLDALAIGLAFVGPIVGSMVGYELSLPDGDDYAVAAEPDSVTWQPSVSLTPNMDGAVVGIQGTIF